MTFEVKILSLSHPLLTSEVIVRLGGAGHLRAMAIRRGVALAPRVSASAPSGVVEMLHVAFVGTFTASLEQPVRRHLTVPCEIVVASETDILPKLSEIDVLVTMGLTAEMGQAATRLKLLQVPGAGVDRVDRTAVPAGAVLANSYGHEVGIAEYVIGAMLALTREFSRLDAGRRGALCGRGAAGDDRPHRSCAAALRQIPPGSASGFEPGCNVDAARGGANVGGLRDRRRNRSAPTPCRECPGRRAAPDRPPSIGQRPAGWRKTAAFCVV
jgi:hypothetical protein